ncbi:MAG: hypothetical protein K8W52_11340 [Deltaproteobacteria bacterium]|nr:hypothetical protein [Deltaproteobacteria bacterium]
MSEMSPPVLDLPAPRRHGVHLVALALVLVAVAALGSYVTQRQLDGALSAEGRGHLAHGRDVFALARQQTVEGMEAQCRLLVEDPRLKATLATEGIDRATIADMLGDLARLRSTGLLVVLSPEGRVLAEAGAAELDGLDLSVSSVFKSARTTAEPVGGSWVIGGKVIDLSIMAIRFDNAVVAYLVVGQTLDRTLLVEVANATGLAFALVVGADLTQVSDDRMKALASALPPAGVDERLFEVAGESFRAVFTDLEPIGQARPRLAVIQAVAVTPEAFAPLRWLLWLPSLLVLVAVVLTASRFTSRAS